jgi:hypothetical protein
MGWLDLTNKIALYIGKGLQDRLYGEPLQKKSNPGNA